MTTQYMTPKVRELFNMFIDEDLMDDRREYDVVEYQTAYPELTEMECIELNNAVQVHCDAE